jgi:hypothetical protein
MIFGCADVAKLVSPFEPRLVGFTWNCRHSSQECERGSKGPRGAMVRSASAEDCTVANPI